jgi:hypothetical protein
MQHWFAQSASEEKHPKKFASLNEYHACTSFMNDVSSTSVFTEWSSFCDEYCDYLDKGLNNSHVFAWNKEIKSRFLKRGPGFDVFTLQLLKLAVPTGNTGPTGMIVLHSLSGRPGSAKILDRLDVPMAEPCRARLACCITHHMSFPGRVTLLVGRGLKL